jgi:co-chaperonin GroES (HSP10)
MITPIDKRLILLPSESEMRGLFFIPEQYKDAATACLVIARGSKVNPFIKKDSVVLCEIGFSERLTRKVGNTAQFWCQESNVYAILIDGKIHPYGRKVLIRRAIQETHINGILIPENRRYQSLEGTIERLGLCREHFKVNGLKLGARIRLVEWKEHMKDVTLEDGSYGLIVHESDLLLEYED